MCAACVEYTKDKLTIDEFGSALQEMTREDKAHADAVNQLIREYSGKPEQLKKELQKLPGKS